VKRAAVALIVTALALVVAGIVFAAANAPWGGSDSADTGQVLGVVPRSGECVLLDHYNIGATGRPGPQSPVAAVALIQPGERDLDARRVAADRVFLERFEHGKKVALYEVQLFDGFAPKAWMVTTVARSMPCEAAKNAGPPPEVPPINRPEEPPSP
jgi:hypothetical protein